MSSEIKKTPLYEELFKLGGRMVEFDGYSVPVQFEGVGVLKEHEIVRSSAGIFEISYMGEMFAKGKDVIAFLNSIVTNDLKLLENGKAQYACMCYPNGTVVDDLYYYQESPTEFRLIVNGANVEKDWKWLNEHLGSYDVKLTNLTDSRSRLAIQGPKTQEFITPIIDTDLTKLKRFYFVHCNLAGKPVFLARTGYTGEDGFEFSCANEDVIPIFHALLKAGLKPIGLGARDSLRLECCYSLYGNDISDKITPIEANIGWAVKPKDGINYIGKEVLMKQKTEGTARKLVGLNLIDRGILREHYKVFKDGNEIGFVTSGVFAPTLKKTVGLALIDSKFTAIGTELGVEIRGKLLKAVIVPTPFYKRT